MSSKLRWSIVVALFAVSALAQTVAPPPPAVLPLDPLTPAEVTSAQQIATRDQRVRNLAGDNPRVIVVQFIAAKRGHPEPFGRWAEVIVHNDALGGGARVLVNLSGGSVADVVRVTERNVPIGVSDVELAAALALDNARVQQLLGGRIAARFFPVGRGAVTRERINENRIDGVHHRGVDPDDPCTIHRCVTLFFRQRGRYILMNQVTVDLTARQVMVREQATGGAQP
jgi:hypothetical protein